MKSYPSIDFSSFSIIEICDFVSSKIHQDISNVLNSITKELFENDNLFLESDKNQILSIYFIQLKEECEQLIRIESLVFLPFLKKKIVAEDYSIPKTAVDKIYNYQNTALSMYFRLKNHINNFNTNQGFLPIEQIIINDLINLENLLSDWINIVRDKIVNAISNKLSDNEFV